MSRHMMRVASYVILLRQGEVFLMRRHQTGWMDGWYGLPSGHVEEGETPRAAAIRETGEETGVTLQPAELELAVVMHRQAGNAADREYIDFFFTAGNWDGSPSQISGETWEGEPRLMEKDKCDEVGWFSLQNLPDKILPYIRDAIKAARDGKNYLER